MPALIRYRDVTPVPWVNGQGRTSELITWAAGRRLSSPGTVDWRLSVAQLDGPAPFSPIPGVRRSFMPAGTDVTLSVNGTHRRVTDRTVTSFAGDDDVALEKLNPCPGHAVNLMVRAGQHESPGPELVVTDTGDASFGSCLVAVALESAAGVSVFDVLTPGRAEGAGRALRVALVQPPRRD